MRLTKTSVVFQLVLLLSFLFYSATLSSINNYNNGKHISKSSPKQQHSIDHNLSVLIEDTDSDDNLPECSFLPAPINYWESFYLKATLDNNVVLHENNKPGFITHSPLFILINVLRI